MEGWRLTGWDRRLHWKSMRQVLPWWALWHRWCSGVTHGNGWSGGRNRRSRRAWRHHAAALCVLWTSSKLTCAFSLILRVVGSTEKQSALRLRRKSKKILKSDLVLITDYSSYLRPIFCAKSTVGWTLISKREGIFFPAWLSVGLLWPGVGSSPTPGGGFGSGEIPCFLRSSSSNSSSLAFSSSVLIIWIKTRERRNKITADRTKDELQLYFVLPYRAAPWSRQSKLHGRICSCLLDSIWLRYERTCTGIHVQSQVKEQK